MADSADKTLNDLKPTKPNAYSQTNTVFRLNRIILFYKQIGETVGHISTNGHKNYVNWYVGYLQLSSERVG